MRSREGDNAVGQVMFTELPGYDSGPGTESEAPGIESLWAVPVPRRPSPEGCVGASQPVASLGITYRSPKDFRPRDARDAHGHTQIYILLGASQGQMGLTACGSSGTTGGGRFGSGSPTSSRVAGSCSAKVAAERGQVPDADELQIPAPFAVLPVGEELSEDVCSHLLRADEAHFRPFGYCHFTMDEGDANPVRPAHVAHRGIPSRVADRHHSRIVPVEMQGIC